MPLPLTLKGQISATRIQLHGPQLYPKPMANSQTNTQATHPAAGMVMNLKNKYKHSSTYLDAAPTNRGRGLSKQQRWCGICKHIYVNHPIDHILWIAHVAIMKAPETRIGFLPDWSTHMTAGIVAMNMLHNNIEYDCCNCWVRLLTLYQQPPWPTKIRYYRWGQGHGK